MTEWLLLSEEQRRTTLEQAAINAGIPAKAVEKDWWVTLTLKALFQSKYGHAVVFKGGTSLSKCWKLIERFSEDIDIALDSEVFGIKYEVNPSKGYINTLKRRGCEFTSNELRLELENKFRVLGVSENTVSITSAPVRADLPDTDPQTITIAYPSLFDPNPYLADQVKIEVSVRSLKEPFSQIKIQSVLTENFPNELYPETPFEVSAVEPHRTFLEKIFLLHEEFLRPDKSKIKTERMSRHLYDLVRMMDQEAGKKALEDHDLYVAIIRHREHYSRLSWVDYSTLHREKVNFIPTEELLEAYGTDYETMREQMIHGNAPEFKELIEVLEKLVKRLRGL